MKLARTPLLSDDALSPASGFVLGVPAVGRSIPREQALQSARPSDDPESASANRVSESSATVRQRVTVDRGATNGVFKGQAVVADEGLLGQTLRVELPALENAAFLVHAQRGLYKYVIRAAEVPLRISDKIFNVRVHGVSAFLALSGQLTTRTRRRGFREAHSS